MRSKLSIALSWISLFLTASAVLIVGYAWFSSGDGRDRNGAADTTVFALIWAYILITPFLSTTALVLGDQSNWLVRSNITYLVIWVVFVIWTLTLSF